MAKVSRPRPDTPPVQVVPRPTGKNWTFALEKRPIQIAVVVLIAFLAIITRVVNLSADPPLDVSWSQDLLTDPPQYSSYARTAVAYGDWNPLNDERLVFFRKNITGAFSFVVFSLFGPSVTTANLTAVLLNLVAIGFLAWGAGRAFGFLAGAGAALALAMNYLFASYGRQPFLEVASNACLAFAFWGVIAGARRWWWLLAAGVVAGLGTFYGKVTALHALPAFLAAVILQSYDTDSNVRGLARWRGAIGYVAGFAVVGLTWYIFAYSAASSEVRAYLTEQSRTLYGAPVGLQSLQGFMRQFFTFGIDTKILAWSPIAAIAGLIGLIWMSVQSVRERMQQPWWRRLPPATVLVVGWFLCAYLAFSPFNYRPVRYQIVLWLPLAVGFGWFLTQLVHLAKTYRKDVARDPQWWLIPILWAIIAIGLQHFVFEDLLDRSGRGIASSSHSASMIVGLLLSLLIVYWSSRANSAASRFGSLPQIVVAILLLGVVIEQGRHFVRWWNSPIHTIDRANADLAQIIGEGAVVTGEWSAPLTQLASSPLSLTHFFSLEEPKDFFASKPITHVIVEDKADGPFFKDFPELAENAAKVTNYAIRGLRIGVFRVSRIGGNAQAAAYKPTFLERLREEPSKRMLDDILSDLSQRITDSANNFSGWSYAAELYRRADRKDDAAYALVLDHAESAYANALDHAPDDLVMLVGAGDLSWERYRTDGGPEDRDRAVEYWQRALRVTPNNPQLLERLRQAGVS